jgi:cell wall assembly regulator SMI1
MGKGLKQLSGLIKQLENTIAEITVTRQTLSPTSMDASAFWDFFESELEEDSLPSGASEEAIKEVEALMKVALPPEVRKFYGRHDGSGSRSISPWEDGFGQVYFLSLEKMASTWEFMCETGKHFEEEEDDFGTQIGPIKENYWNPAWIPFAENQCGDNFFLDFDPAKGGVSGQVVDWWHEQARSKLISSSFAELLQICVTQISEGALEID